MKNNLINVFMFAVGAVIGSAVTWKFVKTKYEQIANEEIQSVKTYYTQKNAKNNDEPVVECKEETNIEPEITENEKEEYIEIIRKSGYTNYHKVQEEKGSVDDMENDKPYVISPEEFGELVGYDAITLTYYADGILADDDDEMIDEIDDTIGADSLSHFGEYEEDAVFVRNDARCCDYEILRDYRNYTDVVG